MVHIKATDVAAGATAVLGSIFLAGGASLLASQKLRNIVLHLRGANARFRRAAAGATIAMTAAGGLALLSSPFIFFAGRLDNKKPHLTTDEWLDSPRGGLGYVAELQEQMKSWGL